MGERTAGGWYYSATLGNNSTTNSLVPVAVDTSGVLAGKTVTAISAGWDRTCAVADGRAYCWGGNYTGGIGNNSTADSLVPVAVDTSGVLAGKTVTAISTGWGHTCVLADGRAYCWGSNKRGQLGNNNTTNSSVPVAVDTSGVLHNKKVTAISAGGFHSCVIVDGRASCWGKDYRGELGNNRTGKSKVPVAVDTSGVLHNKKVTAISANVFHTCAIADGRAFCWGRNNRGELGDNSWTKASVPVAVDTTGVLRNQTVTAISTGRRHTAVLFRLTPRK